MPLDSKHTEASCSPNSTDLCHLQVARVPRSLYLAILCPQRRQNPSLDPCACAQGNNAIEGMGGDHYAKRTWEEHCLVCLQCHVI